MTIDPENYRLAKYGVEKVTDEQLANISHIITVKLKEDKQWGSFLQNNPAVFGQVVSYSIAAAKNNLLGDYGSKTTMEKLGAYFFDTFNKDPENVGELLARGRSYAQAAADEILSKPQKTLGS